MGSLLVELAPFAVGLAVTPAAILTGILLLGSRRPLPNDAAFAAAFAVVYGVLSVVVLAASAASSGPLLGARTKSALCLAAGLVLLALAIATALRRPPPGTPQRPSPLLARVDSASPRRAFAIGCTLAVLNPNVPILAGGLSVVAAEASGVARLAGVGLLLLGAEAGLAGPLVWYALDRRRATRALGAVHVWLTEHHRSVDLVVLVVFGLLFTVTGARGL